MRYTICDANNGAIKRILECPESMAQMQVVEGEILIEGTPDFQGVGYRDNGQFVDAGLQPTPWHIFDYDTRQWTEIPRTYRDRRAAEYPPFGDQLDALWHAMNENVLPKVEPFYSSIKAVKDKYPKP